MSQAFVPQTSVGTAFSTKARVPVSVNGFMGDPERESLSRESEPEDYFQTNTDKMSDEEKIPIALAGLAGISLPFILGLIALYAAK
eukprot:CAMPEP_0119546088 /NCGR_PEP_ID=MMETSP1352-20130426/648_1 /TAXON_ID=265584 /ORGANISM="Stauroneis constricta, Strain CCMP1120" /LENGTH=85 /DNA_ID=CAMNT_0007590751 /DNA_START=185 /DNA_END=442 /DNA_ORIENTATION=+